MSRHTPPIGDMDLTNGALPQDETIVDGGAGPSGSDFSSTGELGGMGNTGDTVTPDWRDRPDDDDPEAGAAAGVQTTLGDVVGPGISDLDGSALD